MSAEICGGGFHQFASNFRGHETKKFWNGKKSTCKTSNFSNTGFRTIQSLELIQGVPKWTLNVCKIVIAYVRRLKFCMWIFFIFQNVFVSCSRLTFFWTTFVLVFTEEESVVFPSKDYTFLLYTLEKISLLKRNDEQGGLIPEKTWMNI